MTLFSAFNFDKQSKQDEIIKFISITKYDDKSSA